VIGGPIVIDPGDDTEERLWQVTHEIADLLGGLPWVLIGGQMVTLLEREHGGRTGRVTRDVDALMDVRALTGATKEAARRLESAGFTTKLTNDGLSYRFVRGEDVVDVLGDVFRLPVPTLAGALVIKARAASSSLLAKHRRDLARLLGLVSNIDEMRAQLTGKERGYLRAHQALLDPTNEAWRGIGSASDGIIALRLEQLIGAVLDALSERDEFFG
jgi:hypothetical protein